MNSERIPIAGPWITDKEVAYVSEAARTAWYGNSNQFNQRFETAFAAAVRRTHAVSLPSCTSGLHLALAALGIGPGDEVIVPDLTWIATVAPVVYLGATPVFADVDAATWCLTKDSVAACLTEKTKAVIGVDLYGSMVDWPSLRDFASDRKLALIEDAAEALGSTLDGKPAGAFADVSVFSFHGSKTLTTGEGGMLVTDRADLFDRILCLRDHGRAPGDTWFFNQEIGFKYKMSSLQAAFGLAQLENLDELIRRKRRIFATYAESLRDLPEVTLNAEPARVRNSYWMVTAVLPGEDRFQKRLLVDFMASHKVDCRPFFHPLSSLPAFRHHPSTASAGARNQVSYSVSPFGVNLPSALILAPNQIEQVCSLLKAFIAKSK